MTTPLTEKILHKIRAEKIRPCPRWRCWLKNIWKVGGVIIAFVGAVFVLSFILHQLKTHGWWHGTCFNWPTLANFLPWVVFAIGALLLLSIFFSLRSSPLVYRRPLIFTLGIILAILLGISYLAWRTNAQGIIESHVRTCNCPMLKQLYGVDNAPAATCQTK